LQEIKAIVFDVGNTLLKTNAEAMWKKTNKVLGLKGKRERKASRRLEELFQRGKISFKEFLEKTFGKRIGKKDFFGITNIWERENKPNKRMIRIAKKLKKKYRIALVSNTNKVHAEANRRLGYYRLFPVQVMSNEVKTIKPGKKIYKILLRKLKTKARETVFFDDIKENVLSAKRLGIKAFVFESPEKMEKQLKELGVS